MLAVYVMIEDAMAKWLNLGDDGEGNIAYINLDNVDLIIHDPKKEVIVLYLPVMQGFEDMEGDFPIRKKGMPKAYAAVLEYLRKRATPAGDDFDRFTPKTPKKPQES